MKSLLATLLLCAASTVYGQRFAVTNNGDWNNPGTWASTGCGGASGATVPTNATAVTICNDRTINVTSADGSAASIVFANGNRNSTINVNAGRTLTVAGNINISTSNNSRTRTVAVNAGGTLTVGGNVTLNTLAPNNNRVTVLRLTAAAGQNALATIGGNLTVQNCDADSTSTVELLGTANATLTVNGTTSVTGTGCFINNGAGTLNLNGALTIGANGTFSNNTGTTNLGGDLTHTGTLNADTGTFNFTGGAAQQLLGTAATTTLYNMGMGNAAGLTLSAANHDLQVDRQLTLSSGAITTGANNVIVTPNCDTGAPNQPVVRVAGWVNGNLRKTFPAGAPTCDFEVGDATRYAPVTSLAFSSVSTTGTLQARTDAGDHPETTSDLSGIDAARSANRYWTLSLPGGSALAWNDFSVYSAVFNFDAADVDAGASSADFVITQKSNTIGVWSPLTVGTRTATSTAGGGLARATFFFGWAELVTGPYVAGELKKLAEWRMDDATWTDSSGNGYTGTGSGLSGAPSTSNASPAVAGSPGTCGYGVFDRTNKHFIAVPGAFPDLPTRSFTITAWIRTTDRTQQGQRILIDDVNNAGGWGFSLGDAGAGRLRFFTRGGSSLVIVDSNAGAANEIQDDTWYFVAAAVFVSPSWTFITLYIYNADGSLRDTTISLNFAYTFGSDAGIASIGGETNPPNPEGTNAFGFAGNIDELRVYRTYLGTTHLDAIRQITRPCALVDHYEISHAGSAVNCQAENVTITAHDASHALTAPGASTTITVTARRVSGAAGNRGDWSVVVGGGSFGNGTADDGVATYTFAAGETSVVLSLKNTHVQTVNIDVLDSNGRSETTGTGGTHANPDWPFAQAGFSFSSIATQTAGTTSGAQTLRAITTDPSTGVCTNVFTGLVANIELASECVDPSACQAGQQVTFNNNGSGAIAANNAGSVTAYTPRTLNFGANSTADFTFDYPDVGAIRLHARYDIPLAGGGASGNTMTGSTATGGFVVKPAGFVISNIKRTSDNAANPAAADASGAAFVKAGEAFTLTVRAVNSAGNATPNYGREITPEGVLLDHALAGGLGLTAPGALSNHIVAGTEFGAGGQVSTDANGDATVANLSWSEVGIIRITPRIGDGSYLGAGDVAGTQTGNIGRFYPDHFALTASGTLTPGCGSFTYLGQGLGIASVGVEARNGSGSRTDNYSGSFAKHTPATFASWGFGARDTVTGTNLTARIGSTPSITGSWSGGALTASMGALVVNRSTSPDGPFTSVAIGIAPSDSDGVSLLPSAFDIDVDGAPPNDHTQIGAASAVVRFGRLRTLNALASSPAITLPVTIETQYYNGSAFALSDLDSCTTLDRNMITLDDYRLDLNACETIVNQPTVSFAKGVGTLTLAAPGSNNSGSVRLRPNLGAASGSFCNTVGGAEATAVTAGRAYLQGAWTGSTWTEDPSARASFGVFGSQPRNFIFQRENY